MIKINLYKFSKKGKESTKQPTGTGTELEGQIKEPSSVIRPTIIFSSAIFSDPTAYNYAYIAKFKRYYFIQNITWISGRWEVAMECDVLATYKTEIGSTQMFMLRAAAAGNGYIRDNLSPMTGEEVHDDVVLAHSAVNFASGVYVVNIMGKTTGTSTLYQLTPSNFSSFLDGLLGIIDNTSVSPSDFWGAIKNLIFNPIQYITSAMWFPDAFPASPGGTIKVGLWDSGVSADVITDPQQTITYATVNLSKHPQAATRGKYLNAAPYSHYSLEFDPFGVIELDSSQIIDAASIRIKIYVDALTGQGLLKVYSNDASGACLASITSQYGVPLPLSQATFGGGTISGSIQTIGGIVSGAITGDPFMLADGAAAGIGTMESALRGSTATVGSGGSIIALNVGKKLHASFFKVSGADWSDCGRPYCVDTTPLAGYNLPKEVHVAINGTAEEQAAITRLCEGGFIYE